MGNRLAILERTTPEEFFQVDVRHGRVSDERPAATEAKPQTSSDQCLAQVLDLLKGWWWETDKDLRYTYFSPSIEKHTGLRPSELCGRTRQEVGGFDPESAQWKKHAAQMANREEFEPFEFVRVDGEQRNHFRTMGRPSFDEDGTFQGYRGFAVDVTAERDADARLEQARTLLDTVLQNAPIPIAVRDAVSRQHLFVNNAFEELFEMDRSEIINHTPFESFGPVLGQLFAEFDDSLIASETREQIRPATIEISGKLKRVRTTRLLVKDAAGQPDLIIALTQDVTEDFNARESINTLANFDSLTGVANRPSFLRELDSAVARKRRGIGDFAVLLLDLNRFKEINDTLGHAAGDIVLKEVAKRLKRTIRDTDLVARLGGDEFAIIQAGPEITADDMSALAVRITSELSRPIVVEDLTVLVGSSIGIAYSGTGDSDFDELLNFADIAMYRAKSDSNGSYRFFDQEMSDQASAKRRLKRELTTAVDEGAFELLYQPIVNAETHQIETMEALIRWQHPELGLVPPDEFLGLAEEMNLMPDITKWVLHEACRQAATWPGDIRVAVNVSPTDLRLHQMLPLAVKQELSHSGLASERLELEITEAALISDDDASWQTLGTLRDLGVSIALDDFGTGFSSLSLLSKFRFDKIKIDKSFVSEMGTREACAAIAEGVLSIARRLGTKTTAEGVETETQAAMLTEAGATTLQGYLFSKPIPHSGVSLALSNSACA